ncbi:DUF2306 domain-containing protein [Piscinibacter sp. XHJ-5]|uniref:DUF2306 domain-containing protein n=1 Tax=Piscinibacter sp. XHJ-5 TaxID=3037797 RepID=UPI0024536BF3|nr:DUF2306 domain-containing protein [Piscinibacter sp. XHJ-5]
MSPAVIVHLVFALAAFVSGPVALLARKGTRWHRASGYVWVTLMFGAALSSLFIRDFRLPNIAGYTPIHLITIGTIAALAGALYAVAHRNIRRHRRAMWGAYLGGCVVAGLFALLPGRFLGHWLWHQTLGLI